MTSGVRRARVRSRRPWRMISWPAANEMRWVKPSMATVSPSRTSVAMASRMEATLVAAMGRSARRLDLVEGTRDGRVGQDGPGMPGHCGNALGEDAQGRGHLGFRHGQ